MLFSRHFFFLLTLVMISIALMFALCVCAGVFFLFFVALPPILRPSRRVRVVINLTYTSSLLNNDE